MSCRTKSGSDAAILDWLETWGARAERGPLGVWTVSTDEPGHAAATGLTLRETARRAMDSMERAGAMPAGCFDGFVLPRRTERTRIGD